jgi:hypothetical protein
VTAQSNQAVVTFTTPAAGLVDPILVVRSYDSGNDPSVAVDGVPLEAGSGFFASRDSASKTLWITLMGNFAGAKVISVAPKP